MSARFVDVLARRGPGYDLDEGETRSAPRETLGGRLFDAVTHSGPAYAPASPQEAADDVAARQQARKRLAEFLHASFGKTLAAKNLLDAMGPSGSPGARANRRAAERELREFVEYFHTEWHQVSTCIRETSGPLDLRTRYLLARLNRLQRRTVQHVEYLVEELARGDERSDHTAPQTTRVSIRHASMAAGEVRSLADLLHAAVR